MKILDDTKIRYILLAIIIILELIIISLQVTCYSCQDKEVNSDIKVNEVNDIVKEDIDKEEIEVVEKVKVDIKGAVKKPGVYELEIGSRVSDVINIAGGLKSNASTKYLNLSKKITDEMVIKVYTETQIKNMNITYNVKEECNSKTQDISNCAGASIIDSGSSSNDITTSTKVSLNKASKEELMTLSGIGESKADAIIEYRNKNNGFKTLEELMNVSGIGEAAYNKIKDYITL